MSEKPSYYVKQQATVSGPLAAKTIKRLVATGKIQRDDLIAANKRGPWSKAKTIKSLTPSFLAACPTGSQSTGTSDNFLTASQLDNSTLPAPLVKQLRKLVAPKVICQWAPGGIEQFVVPKTVVKFSADGGFAFFSDSVTGVPVSELEPEAGPHQQSAAPSEAAECTPVRKKEIAAYLSETTDINHTKIPEVTDERVNVLLKEYLDKTVRFSEAKFIRIETGPYRSYTKNENLMVFTLQDSKKHYVHGFLADKSKFAEFLFGLETMQNIEVIVTVGQHFYASGRHVTYTVKSIKLIEDATTLVNRGNDEGNKGQFNKAIGEYTKAIEIDPDCAIAYYNRGVIHQKKGESDKAIADSTEAIRFKPDYFGAYLNRGLAYVKAGKIDLAINDFTEAIRLKPDYAQAYASRGVVYLMMTEPTKAEADFDKAKELAGPQDFDFNQVFRQATGGGGQMPPGFDDLFRQFSGGAGRPGAASRPQPTRGADLNRELTIPFATAVTGGKAQFTVPRPDGKEETITVSVPTGLKDGQKIRLRGKGETGAEGNSGDLLLTVHVAEHPCVQRRGEGYKPE